MQAHIETDLATSADRAWETLLKKETFAYITRGFLGFNNIDPWPDRFGEDFEIKTGLVLFGLLPLWRHEMRVIRVDPQQRLIESREGGGPVHTWNHLIKLTPLDERHCRYLDEVELKAGLLTPLVWLFAQVFYRYRQARWRRLARTL